MRLLIYAAFILIAYSFIRSLIRGVSNATSRRSPRAAEPFLDEMVKCSVCDTYVPQSQAIVKRSRGSEVVVCGKECEAKL